MKKPIFSLLTCLIPLFLDAQAPPPNPFGGQSMGGSNVAPAPAPTSAPDNTNTMNVTPLPSLIEGETAENFADRAFDTNSDSVDFEEGTLNWKGRTFNIGSSRVARARFERYLASPRISDDDEIYLGILGRVSELLSLAGEADMKDSEQLNDEIFQAWKLLFVAGRYELDNGTSLVVANQVYNIWRVRDENQNISKAKILMADERQRLERDLSSNSWMDEKKFEQTQRDKAQGRHTGEVWEGVTDATFTAERLAETKGRIAAMETQSVTNGLQAKLQFQSQIVNLLLSRRYEHCLIAATFYRYVFRGSHQQVQVGMNELSNFMPISDFTPTIETVELLAREAIGDVRIGMNTVDSLYANNELYAAMERLQETYLLGEYQTVVLQFPVDKKRKLLELYRSVSEVKNLLDLKDYGEVEKVVEKIQTLSYDFPASRILSGVRSAQRLSNLSLMSAQQAVGLGDFSKAEAGLARATQIWPLNPAVKSYTHDMANKADISSQATLFFDEAYSRDDFRSIFDRRTEFGAALMRDPTRSQQLKEAVERIGKVDILIAQASELATQDNAHAAWEILLSASEIEPNDPNLARSQAKLAPRVAEFVSMLDAAERAEAKDEFAIALNRYLTAQDLYPASKTSRLGIERTGEKLMNQLGYGI